MSAPTATEHAVGPAPAPGGWRLVRERTRIAETVIAASATALAAAGIMPLFDDLSWVLPALLMIAVIAVIGAASRAVAMPLPLIPIAEAIGLVVVVTVLFASEAAWAAVVPTGESWDAVLALARQGLLDAQEYAAPAPAVPGLTLLAVAGVGLVALSVDTLFVSVRSPILAGIPLAAVYLVPGLATSLGPPWWALPLAGAGWLLLLAADQREQIRQWGGLPGTERIRGLSTSGRRSGVIMLIVAAAVATVIPAGSWAPWRSASGDGLGAPVTGGAPTEVVLDPLVSMRRSLFQPSDTEVLTYRTLAPRPSYLRIAALETFDGQDWSPREGLATRRDPGTPLPGNVLSDFIAADANNRVTGGDSFTYEIEVGSLQNSYLPLPYPISEVDDVSGLEADWRIDPSTGVAFSDGVPASGLSYRVKALDPRVEAETLRAASAALGGLWPQLSLPGGLPPSIAQTAREVTAGADTPYDKAVALQRWFTSEGGFTYSTGVRSGADGDYLAEFLADRVGYCEQFAGAMAVMARTLGIPSRVVVGFTQGSPTEGGAWQVTARDAHAWPELWFEGIGWARFEPTPTAQGSVQAPAYAPEVAPLGRDPLEARGLLYDEGFDFVPTPDTAERPVLVTVAWIAAGLVGLLALAWLAAPMTVRAWRRRRRLHVRGFTAAVEGAWAEVGDMAVDHGQTWLTAATPRQAAARLGRGMPPEPAAALDRLRRELEQVRYARPLAADGAPGHGAASGEATERIEAVRADARTIMNELRGRVRWQTRVAAYCWPSSERRRQRSSMRFMKPEPEGPEGAAGASVGAAVSTGPREKAE